MQVLTLVLIFIGAFFAGLLLGWIFSNGRNSKLQIQNIKLEERLNSIEAISKNDKNYSEILKKEFINLANEAILEKNKTLDEMNKKTLEAEINPLKEKLGEFQAKVEEFNLTGAKNTQSLKEQIEFLMSQTKLVSGQTEKLANALSLNSKFRGNFGEIVLEKLLRVSGLVDKKEDYRGNYLLQGSFRDLNGGSSSPIKPDAVIYLADDKNIIVDSKASIAGFLEFTNAEDEEGRKLALDRFYKDTYTRVNELSNKYNNLEGLNTPDFTLLFIPFEACMSYVYSNFDLVEKAQKQNIIIVGPSTLLAALKMVNYVWSNKNRADNIKEILKTGESIYEKCQVLIGKLEGLQTNFETLKKGFEGVFTSLTGRGGLFGQIAKFKDLGFNPSSPIEEKYLVETCAQADEKA